MAVPTRADVRAKIPRGQADHWYQAAYHCNVLARTSWKPPTGGLAICHQFDRRSTPPFTRDILTFNSIQRDYIIVIQGKQDQYGWRPALRRLRIRPQAETFTRSFGLLFVQVQHSESSRRLEDDNVVEYGGIVDWNIEVTA